jgi:hypothetical protein
MIRKICVRSASYISSLQVPLQLDSNPYPSMNDSTHKRHLGHISGKAVLTSHVRPKHLVRLPPHVIIRRNKWSTHPGGTTWRRKGPTSTARPSLAIAQRRGAAIHYSPDKVLKATCPASRTTDTKIRTPREAAKLGTRGSNIVMAK